MAFVRNVDFAKVLSKPAAVAAILLSTLRKILEEEGEGELVDGVVSISEKDGRIAIKTSGPLVASALRLRWGKIESAFSEVLARFWRAGTTTVHIR